MFFFERRHIEKFCQKLIRNALPFGGKERRRLSLSGLLAYFILYKVWSNCSVKSHHLFGTGFTFPVNENLKNRLYCDIYFLLTHCFDISCFTFEGVFPQGGTFSFDKGIPLNKGFVSKYSLVIFVLFFVRLTRSVRSH